ncbi:MAG: metallophosphoesterase [Chitinophagales bacterium]
MRGSFFITLISVMIMYSVFSRLHAQGTVSFTGQELLGRPTSTSIALNIVANKALDVYIKYGTTTGVYTGQTSSVSSAANVPVVIVINNLQSNTKYFYRVQYRITGTTTWSQRTEHFFHTQRPSGSTFIFDITSDSHVNVGGLGNPATWKQTLTNVSKDSPDFLIDCGDTFNMDTISSQSSANNSYIFQRSATAIGLVSPSVPIFLAVGNHEQQEAWHLDDKGNPITSQPVWGTNAEKKYFLNPAPNNFYSGDTSIYSALDNDHLRGDYYSWTWGDALFVVIDPFWFTYTKPFTGNTGGGEGTDVGSGDRWDWTLGDAQYKWLQQTLQNSTAKYKFLFMHHMTGGTQDYIRGGAYAAPYCEWGGYNEDGTTYSFTTRRPAWIAPVHQLLIQNHVSVVFHGHDHQYAYEQRDGIIYQSLPAAGFSGNGFNVYSQQNPLTTKVLPSPGHLRITVTSGKATVDYVSSGFGSNGRVSYSYTINPNQSSSLTTTQSLSLQTLNNKKVILSWEAPSDLQNKQFVVQRSSGGSKKFEDIGTVAVSGSPEIATYNFIDEPGRSGSYLYRISEEDINGKKTFSDAKLAVLTKSNYQIVDNGINWEIHSDQQINYGLFDMQGRLIEKGNFIGTKIITKPLSNSIYVLRTECGGQLLTQKLR